MTKKHKAQSTGKNAPRQRNGGRRWILATGIVGVFVVGAVVGVLVYRANANRPPDTVSSGHTISGTVQYQGTQAPGRVYLGIVDSNGMDTGVGTSIPVPGPYSISGVASGTYTIRGWMDTTNPQTGFPNAASPGGNISVTVAGADLAGQAISISDRSTVPTPVAPPSVRTFAGQGSALVQWETPRDSEGDSLAAYYNVYYSTSASVSPSDGMKVSAPAASHLFLSGLTDGTTYYVVVTAVLGGVESGPSTPATPVTPGAPAGLNTVSGAISFPVAASGPMYVGMTSGNVTSFERIADPVSPQRYSISGVPSGDCVAFAFIDMNDNGVIDTGDLSRTSDDPSFPNKVITVNADMAGVNQTLIADSVLARAVTIHYGAASANVSEVYSLEFELAANRKLPVNVRLVSGPNALVPVDLSGNYYFRVFQQLVARPKAGDQYELDVQYSDASAERVLVSVTEVLDNFPQNVTTGGTRVLPTFSWRAPESPPAEYTYLIRVGRIGVGVAWTYPASGPGMPSSQTSVVYNADGTALEPTLEPGVKYDWLIYLTDSKGNQAIFQTSYTP